MICVRTSLTQWDDVVAFQQVVRENFMTVLALETIPDQNPTTTPS